MPHATDLGRRGEDLAAAHLAAAGHRIIDRNWRCRLGELDLVSEHRGRVVVIEVKTRSSEAFGHPFSAIGPEKLARLHRLGRAWCDAHDAPHRGLRVDGVAVLLPRDGAPRIEHVEDLA